VVPKGERADLRRLSNMRKKEVRDRTAHYNRLRQNHYLLFPEFGSIIKDIKTKTAQYLIEKYPIPEDMEDLNPEELGEELRKVSRGRFGIKEAEALIEAAKSSIGIKDGVASILLEIRQIMEQLALLNRFIAETEEIMKSMLKQVPEIKNIMSVKGIKEITASTIIGEIGDFSGFCTQNEILKFAGLNIFEVSSGLKKGQKHITKVGRSGLRNAVYFAALNTVRKGGVMHDEYKKYIDRGMPRTKALIAICRKLLRTIFSLVKNDSIYTENYNELKIMKKAA
jgi:transposase